MGNLISALVVATFALGASSAFAETAKFTVNAIDATGVGRKIGSIRLTDTSGGLTLSPDLKGLPPGEHGFHVHLNPSCEPGPGPNGQTAPGMAAGSHYDPMSSGKHLGPMNAEGHKGDLPTLVVDNKGNAKKPVVAPRLMVAEVRGHSIMIHAGGDNSSDQPLPFGGGGARIACGVVK